MNKKDKLFNILENQKNEFFNIIFIAFLLGVSTSLLSNYITNIFDFDFQYILYISIVLLVILIILFLKIIYKRLKCNLVIDAVLAIDKNNKKLIPIIDYGFSEHVKRALNAVFLENSALKDSWNQDIINEKEIPKKNANKKEVGYITITRVIEKPNKEKVTINKAIKLLNEVVEYVVIEQLSTNLSGFFSDYTEPNKYIKMYNRKDISSYLLDNRILNILSTPFEDRSMFSKFKMEKQEDGEIIAIYGTDGSHYSMFDLILPNNSIISRSDDGWLTIENSKIVFRINIENFGYSHSMPTGFIYNYLGIENDMYVKTIHIKINIEYKMKFNTIFSRSIIHYHSWVDSFAEKFEKFSSFNDFLERINWHSCITNVIISNKRKNILNNRKEKIDETTESGSAIHGESTGKKSPENSSA
jgi:hypothetical protein